MDFHSSVLRFVTYILLFSCINLFIGCNRFYRPVEVDSSSAVAKQTSLKTLSGEARYFILRQGDKSFALESITFDQAAMTLTSNVSEVAADHQLYIKDQKQRYRYSKARHEENVLKEVHLFVRDSLLIDSGPNFSLPLSEIEKIEVIEHDKGKTSTSYILGGAGIVLGAVLAAVLIAAATQSQPEPQPQPEEVTSCPYISAYNGQEYVLQGELYGGAIFPQLQRDDYLPLQIRPSDNTYKLKISNELKEIQHTDFADLLVVEHAPNQKVMIDPDGQIHTVTNPISADRAILNEHMDVKTLLTAKDRQSCLFNDPESRENSESLYLTFKNEQHFSKAKLIMNLRSSSWFDHLYSKFTRAFGNYYNTWTSEQLSEPAEKMHAWMNEQNIPLVISVKTPEGWKEVRRLNTIGPLLNREIVIPLDLPAGDLADIKLTCGYMFWELDYAAIDYTVNPLFAISRLKPYEAINEKQMDVLPFILNADKKFLDQPEVGDATILKYRSKEAAPGKMQSVFLHSSGHYQHIREYDGRPKTAFLKSFSQPGALSAFSKQEFARAWDKLADVSK